MTTGVNQVTLELVRRTYPPLRERVFEWAHNTRDVSSITSQRSRGTPAWIARSSICVGPAEH